MMKNCCQSCALPTKVTKIHFKEYLVSQKKSSNYVKSPFWTYNYIYSKAIIYQK